MTKLSIWHGCTLRGKPVSKELAAQIIIRTTNLRGMIIPADLKWKTEVFQAFGIPVEWDTDTLDPDLDEYFAEAVQKYGIIADEHGFSQLEFFSNWRIFSARGSHGWIDWDGVIFSNTMNLGKYPSEEIIADEWKLIASRFPTLDLEFHLFEKPLEQLDSSSVPLYQYTVREGAVSYESYQGGSFLHPGNVIQDLEKGVTLEYLKWALEISKV